MTLIELDDVLKQVDQQVILKKVTLAIPQGSQIGIQMTHVEAVTLFRLLRGQLTPTSGVVTRDTQRVAVLLVGDGLYPQLTVRDYLKTFQHLAGTTDDLGDQLQHFALSDAANLRLKHLSFDQQQRLALLRAYLGHPDVVLIESPLTKLTNSGTELYLQALSYLRGQQVTVLITSYALEELVLTSTTIYRYRPELGLQRTDLADESAESPADSPEAPAPQPILKVACKVEDKTVFFSPNEIDFIESVNGVSQINVAGESFTSPQTMATLEKQLMAFGFFRCHRSYLVNLQQISELISYSRNSYTLILKTQSKLPLSRTKLADLRQLIEF